MPMSKKNIGSLILNRKWIITIVISLQLVTFSVISLLSYFGTKEYILEQSISHTLPLLSDNLYSKILSELKDPINISSLMAQDTFLINWVQNGEKDITEIEAYLSRIKKEYEFTSSFFVSNITNQYYSPNGILKTISETDEHDVWFFDFRDMDKSYNLDVDSDQASNDTLTMFINHRLENTDGEFLGVVGVGLQMKDLRKRLSEYQEEYGHITYLTNTDGLIQVHTDPSLIEKVNIFDEAAVDTSEYEILSSETPLQFSEYVQENDKITISIRYLSELDLFLVVEENQNRSLTSARNSLCLSIAIGLFTTILLTLLTVRVLDTYNKKLEYMASYDKLTSLYNRHIFLNIFQKSIIEAERYNSSLSVLLIDIDDFKDVNDRYGHIIGDKMLKKISTVIKDTLRTSDIICRWGGEEFLCLLPHTKLEEAVYAANRLCIQVEKNPLVTNKLTITKTLSIGVAEFSDHMEIETIVDNADKALQKAKRNGKNQVSTG